MNFCIEAQCSRCFPQSVTAESSQKRGPFDNKGCLSIFLNLLTCLVNTEHALSPRCTTLSTTRWTSTGDTGGVAMAHASTGSPTTATSNVPPTGHPPLTTTGGPSTRRRAVALTSKSRNQRITPGRAKERQN